MRGVPLIVNSISGGAGGFLFVVESHVCCFHGIYSIMSFRTLKKNLKKNFMAPLYGWGSTASRLHTLRR